MTPYAIFRRDPPPRPPQHGRERCDNTSGVPRLTLLLPQQKRRARTKLRAYAYRNGRRTSRDWPMPLPQAVRQADRWLRDVTGAGIGMSGAEAVRRLQGG